MQDVFIEYLVKRKNTPQTALLKAAIIAGAILVFLVAMVVSSLLGPFSIIAVAAAVGALYGGYYLLTSMNVEYEYAVTNGEMDVDKIIAQRKRKRILNIKCKEVEDFGRYKAAEHQNKNYQTKLFACDDPAGEDLWFFVSRQKEKGLTLLVFNANEKMLNGIKPFLPGPIMHRAFRIGS